MKPAHLAFILFIDMLWAMNMVAVKEIIDATGPLTGSFLRYVIVLLFMLPWLRLVKGRMLDIVIAGIVSGAIFMALGGLSFALTENVAALAIAGQLGVPFSLLLAVIFLGEKIRWIRIVGTGASFVGIAIMGFDPAIWDERLGVSLTIIASFTWAVGSLLFRRLKGVNPLTIHAWLAFVSAPVLLAGALWFEPSGFARVADADTALWGWLLYAAVGSSIIGHAGMSWLLQRYPVTTIMPLTLPTPLVAAIIAVVVYDTPISMEFVIGALVTFVGVAVVTWRSVTQKTDEELVKEWAREVKR
ncbi:DMT family transporter [Sphingosinicella soli]|uniref:O-acetylserine/cysteine efflux transporter n=1 Tax=Sphingosinicella soli TaxID=333708 RepID=A0A7W7F7P5_9SPHN|nr:DMT family transporter [Sphingosinicella soli]MBB4632899.1 O-acetylserine/cysteine efflux transporter [Sphingosinicella soli]